MADQPEALRMADSLDKFSNPWDKGVASELRRLHHENELLKAEVMMEREACAQYVEQCCLPDSYSQACLLDIANELRARSKT